MRSRGDEDEKDAMLMNFNMASQAEYMCVWVCLPLNAVGDALQDPWNPCTWWLLIKRRLEKLSPRRMTKCVTETGTCQLLSGIRILCISNGNLIASTRQTAHTKAPLRGHSDTYSNYESWLLLARNADMRYNLHARCWQESCQNKK